jgi:hypothetical protein
MLMQVIPFVILYCGMIRLLLAATHATRSPGLDTDLTSGEASLSTGRRERGYGARGRSRTIVPRVATDQGAQRAPGPISPPASLPHRRIAPAISDR